MSNIAELFKSKNFFVSVKGVSEENIKEAESALNLKFAPDFREYLAEFGVASYEGHELTGLCNSQRLNVVYVTKTEKTLNPSILLDWYVIEKVDVDGIIAWQASDGSVFYSDRAGNAEKIADSFVEYISGNTDSLF